MKILNVLGRVIAPAHLNKIFNTILQRTDAPYSYRIGLIWGRLIMAISLIYPALELRSPTFLKLRPWIFWVVVILGGVIFLSGITAVKREFSLLNAGQRVFLRRLNALSLTAATATLILSINTEAQFHLAKYRVLHTDTDLLARVGQHLLVGYQDGETARNLVRKQAIGGLFITTRNIQNRTPYEIQNEIQSFQEIRQQQGLLPLWIATDQEGGIVSRLSPPLTQLPPISTVVDKTSKAHQQDAVVEYAQVHGRELANLGVNLNFAPVVDLNQGVINPDDKYSRIYQRAISDDPTLVTETARTYCQTLWQSGVTCTLKHFPGLGRVTTDTHVASAQLDTAISELAVTDWIPFQKLMGQIPAFTMLGHAKLMDLDEQHPASVSQAVIADLLRDEWNYDGVLITDDFCMKAIYGQPGSTTAAAIQAINVGVDLVLITYDSDLYYPVMDALLQADRKGKLDSTQLSESQDRLQRQMQLLTAKNS